jgi:hypothetical protein
MVIYDDSLAAKRTVAELHQRIRTRDARFLSMRRREVPKFVPIDGQAAFDLGGCQA